MTRVTVLFVFAVAPLALACSSTQNAKNGVSGDAGLSDASAEAKLRAAATDACNAQAAAYCGRLSACYPTFLAVEFGDQATCAARVAVSCTPTLLAPGSSTTPDDARACAQAVANADCPDLFVNPPDACKTKPGTLADGSQCAFDTQCAGRSCTGTSGCGVCTTRAPSGASCQSAPCDYGLVCANGACTAPQSEGASCDAKTPCKAPLQCQSGACTAPGEAGASCDPKSNQPVSTCDGAAGLWCEPTSKTCKSVVVNVSGACGPVSGDLALCGKGGQCAAVDGGAACIGAAHDNTSCASAPCLAPARCVDGTCRVLTEASCQ